jgi:hypothetical protein
LKPDGRRMAMQLCPVRSRGDLGRGCRAK